MKRKILTDHKKVGKTLVPPFSYMLGPLTDVSWLNTVIPETIWIGLIQNQFGYHRGVEIITSLTRAARKTRASESPQIFVSASSFSVLTGAEWSLLRDHLNKAGVLSHIQSSLRSLIALYPECPLTSFFETSPTNVPDDALAKLKLLVSSLLNRTDREPMMLQATAVWLAFDSGVLKVAPNVSLARFPEIEHYPETELSRQVGGAVRSVVNMLFGPDQKLFPATSWPRYFWNRGLSLSPCELPYE